jgi:protein phosphatase 1D
VIETLNIFQVSPDPDVEVHDLNKCNSRFIVLASDGVTNMIRPNESVQMVANFEARKRRGVRGLKINNR